MLSKITFTSCNSLCGNIYLKQALIIQLNRNTTQYQTFCFSNRFPTLHGRADNGGHICDNPDLAPVPLILNSFFIPFISKPLITPLFFSVYAAHPTREALCECVCRQSELFVVIGLRKKARP